MQHCDKTLESSSSPVAPYFTENEAPLQRHNWSQYCYVSAPNLSYYRNCINLESIAWLTIKKRDVRCHFCSVLSKGQNDTMKIFWIAFHNTSNNGLLRKNKWNWCQLLLIQNIIHGALMMMSSSSLSFHYPPHSCPSRIEGSFLWKLFFLFWL